MRPRLKVRHRTLRRGDYCIIVNYVKKTGHIIDAVLYRDETLIAETDDPSVIKQWLVVA